MNPTMKSINVENKKLREEYINTTIRTPREKVTDDVLISTGGCSLSIDELYEGAPRYTGKIEKVGDKTSVLEYIKQQESQNGDYKTHLGCMSYEYLKSIKKKQLENGNTHDQAYLYLLLYFACYKKITLSGKPLNLFDDIFIVKAEEIPTLAECQKYVIRDSLDLINNPNNIEIFIPFLEEDENIINSICEEYGNLHISLLMKEYKEINFEKNSFGNKASKTLVKSKKEK